MRSLSGVFAVYHGAAAAADILPPIGHEAKLRYVGYKQPCRDRFLWTVHSTVVPSTPRLAVRSDDSLQAAKQLIMMVCPFTCLRGAYTVGIALLSRRDDALRTDVRGKEI